MYNDISTKKCSIKRKKWGYLVKSRGHLGRQGCRCLLCKTQPRSPNNTRYPKYQFVDKMRRWWKWWMMTCECDEWWMWWVPLIDQSNDDIRLTNERPRLCVYLHFFALPYKDAPYLYLPRLHKMSLPAKNVTKPKDNFENWLLVSL
jgi:hypothetical protein